MNENTMNNDVTMNNAVTMRPDRGASLGRIDQYELIRELGGGGFGCVYLAKDTVAGIEVAVKGLPPLVRLNKEELENVRKNFALVSRLHHPNIAAALHLQKVEKAFYDDKADAEKLRVFGGDTLVVMQYAPGVTLSQWRKQFPDGKVPLDKALEITRQIASALDYAHKERIIHRDIKPANVMIETLPDRTVTARVLDFGLAAEIRSSMGRLSLNVTEKSGTRHYMAPEQWSGKKQSKETDQYSLAALFYELILGEVPFASVFDTGDTVLMKTVVENDSPEIPHDLPKPVRLALAKALSKNREDRFGSCIEFVDALVGRASGGMASVLASRARGLRASSRAFFSRAVAILAAVAALGLAVGGIWYWKDLKAKEETRIAAEQKAAEANRRAAEEVRIAAEKKAEEERRARKELASKISSGDKVQLWEGGPYWATRNIGAEKPEDYGYYFWWGDTIGYKRESDKWVAAKGYNTNFSFSGGDNTPTFIKSISYLEREGWIENKNGTYVLTSKHDAAQAHLGGAWRMPTKDEFDDLLSKCDWTWTTRNGKNGYVVRGRGNYASKSIFLPAAGFGEGASLYGSNGYYWSSVLYSGDSHAYELKFDSSNRGTDEGGRYNGQSVRPVQGFTK